MNNIYTDTQYIKDDFDAIELLEELSNHSIKVSDNRISCLCLNSEHDDRHLGNFYYRLDRNTYKCYSCSISGDIFDLIKMVKGCNFNQALIYLKNFIGSNISPEIDKLESLLKRRHFQKEISKDDVIKLPVYFQYDFNFAKKYILEYVKNKRMWSEILLYAYGIGYCEKGYFSDRIIFPIKNSNGDLVSFTARSTIDDNLKYLFPKDSNIGELIWGLNNKWRTIPIFVEGVTDALRLRQYGYNAFAILGNQLGERKIELIRREFKNFKDIIVIPDNDKGGNILLEWFQKLIYDFKIKIGLIEGYNDIDKMNRKEIFKLFIDVKDLSEYQINYWLGSEPEKQTITSVHR